MPKDLDLKTSEEKADRERLVWEMKGQFERALEAYDRLLAEVEAFSPTSQLESNEERAMNACLLMREEGVLLQSGKAEKDEQLMRQALRHAKRSRNSLVIARAELGLGVFYGSANKFGEGEKLLTAALSSFSKGTDYDSKQGYGRTLLNLGGLYGKEGKLVRSIDKQVYKLL